MAVSGVAPADPSKWSEASQRSVSAEWTREYRDIEYSCWRCQAPAIFTAQDQKRAYEVQKAPIDQRRTLCPDCWKRSLAIAQDIDGCKTTWADSKSKLQQDSAFLSKWLQLLKEQEQYVRYRPDTATKNMLGRLLQRIAEQAVAADRPKTGTG